MKLKLKEYENPYWSDSSVLRTAGNIAVELDKAVAGFTDLKNVHYILSHIAGELKSLCDDYGIDFDSLLSHYQEIEDWSNSDSEIVETEKLKEYDDEPWTSGPDYPDTVDIDVSVNATFKYTIEVPKSTAERSDSLSDYIDSEIKEMFPDEYNDYEIDDIDYNYYTRDAYEEDRWEDQRLMDDSEEATQPEDIAKKEEYQKMVTPNFKKGKKLKEAYNYIGTDTGNPGRNDKSHIEHIYTVYDCFGEVETFKTKEDAENYINDHKDDDIYSEEYGCSNGPEFRIDEDDIEVMNKKIIVKDDLE